VWVDLRSTPTRYRSQSTPENRGQIYVAAIPPIFQTRHFSQRATRNTGTRAAIDLTIPIIIKSTQLPGFHKDPADQIIVATSIISGILLLTADEKIIAYPDVTTLS
jgi:PIN domain nuclease of toxin-antitoxin system